MKTIKNLPLMALVFGLGLAFTFSAFKQSQKKKVDVSWYFIGNDIDDADDGSLYTTSPTPTQLAECGNPNPTLPCEIRVPDDVISEVDLDEYFLDMYGDDTSLILGDSFSQKPVTP